MTNPMQSTLAEFIEKKKEEFKEKYPAVKRVHPTDGFTTDIPTAKQSEIIQFLESSLRACAEATATAGKTRERGGCAGERDGYHHFECVCGGFNEAVAEQESKLKEWLK